MIPETPGDLPDGSSGGDLSLGQPPTLADVAALAGVSRQTVSNALNNPTLLRADTLARVQEAIARLGYTPNRAARNLRTRSSRLIGLRLAPVVPHTANPTVDRFVHALVEASRGAGYHVLLFDGDDPEDPTSGYDELVRSTAVDAFVVTDTFRGNQQAAYLESQGVPFVAFGRPWSRGAEDPAQAHPWVDVDGAAGTAAATRHLLERGHRRIAWIGWSGETRIGADRRSGWERAMHEHGDAAESVTRAAETADDADAARAAASGLLDTVGPTAFVCASDTLAFGVLDELYRRGVRVGGWPHEGVAVVGFDDSPLAGLYPGGLSSVRQPLEDVAYRLVALLGARLGGAPVASTSPEIGALLEPSLIIRASSG